MDNFNLQGYIASGKLHSSSKTLTEDKKQGYDDREDESLGARRGAEKGKKQSMKDRRDDSYGKFGKRDAEKKGKNKINKESLSETIAEAKSKIDEGSYPFDQCLSDNEGKYGKKGAAKVCGYIKAQYGEGIVKEEMSKKYEEDDIKKEEMSKKYEEDDIKKEEMSSKMKKSDLKAKIKETILAELSLQEAGFEADNAGSQFHDSLYTEADEDVDVDVDFEDEVNVDAEGDDIEIERPAVKAKVQVGLSPEEEIVQDSLKAAMDAADALGNDKLADQIGNTITFFTREYVVGRNSD